MVVKFQSIIHLEEKKWKLKKRRVCEGVGGPGPQLWSVCGRDRKFDKKNEDNLVTNINSWADIRQKEVKTILEQLSEFDLDSKYEPIKKLYGLLKTYIAEGNRMLVNIPFPEIKRRIKGLLAISINEEVWLKLEKE